MRVYQYFILLPPSSYEGRPVKGQNIAREWEIFRIPEYMAYGKYMFMHPANLCNKLLSGMWELVFTPEWKFYLRRYDENGDYKEVRLPANEFEKLFDGPYHTPRVDAKIACC